MHTIYHVLNRKFRVKGWSNFYGKWIEGFLVLQKEDQSGEPIATLIAPISLEFQEDFIEVNPYTICRFTGKYIDKETPVYEYDKVKFVADGKPRIDIVVEREGEWVLKLYKLRIDDIDLRAVVGNVKEKLKRKGLRLPTEVGA